MEYRLGSLLQGEVSRKALACALKNAINYQKSDSFSVESLQQVMSKTFQVVGASHSHSEITIKMC